ncbi:hypothetical protein ABH908_000226 [Pseudomonas frederiksbergensis]
MQWMLARGKRSENLNSALNLGPGTQTVEQSCLPLLISFRQPLLAQTT